METPQSIGSLFLSSAIKRFKTYKELGDKTFEQLSEADFHFKPASESNSLAQIIQHLNGNMLSRWTNFLTEDGEKEWRQRDTEFMVHQLTLMQILGKWEQGWACLFNALEQLTDNDLTKTIRIRTEPINVLDAINRQLSHYPHHVGQIVYIGKLIKNESWKSLSIEIGKSEGFNESMRREHGL